MQSADDERAVSRSSYTCSACDSPAMHVDKWSSDDDDDDAKSSSDSGPSTDSTGDWYQRQVVHAQHVVAGNFRYQRETPREQDTQAATAVSTKCDSTLAGL